MLEMWLKIWVINVDLMFFLISLEAGPTATESTEI